MTTGQGSGADQSSSKYAHRERERRWLVRQIPAVPDPEIGFVIEDRYLTGTGLRLRKMTPLTDGVPQYKLGQKIRLDPLQPSDVMHTTVYLSADEFDALSILPGPSVRKTRYVMSIDGSRFGLDIFEGRHAGLALVEFELPTDSALDVETPAFADKEVTLDDRYSGGALATASDATLRETLQSQ